MITLTPDEAQAVLDAVVKLASVMFAGGAFLGYGTTRAIWIWREKTGKAADTSDALAYARGEA